MKRFLSFLLALILLVPAVAMAVTETPAPEIVESQACPIDTLTEAQLLDLREKIDARLVEMGAYYIEISKQSSGQHVVKLQERLRELGYYTGEITGSWNANSMKAMKAYEKVSAIKSDGNASIDEQLVVFSDQAVTPTPKPTPKPTATPRPTKTPDIYANYVKLNYREVARYPDEYTGTKVKISGNVVQVMGNREEGFTIRIATRGRYDDIVYLVIRSENAPFFNILEYDKLQVYGICGGNYAYQTTMGAEITIPMIDAEEVTLK